MIKYIAVDQYNNFVPIDKAPRKELMDWAGTKHADKMYVDTKAGTPVHVGYVVSGHWFTVLGIEGNKFRTDN